jgi:hypothetical protein
MNQKEKAKRFAQLHVKGTPLLLYNAWDAGSAQSVLAAGAKAIATSSWSVAAAQGYQDGDASACQVASCVDSHQSVVLCSLARGEAGRIFRPAICSRWHWCSEDNNRMPLDFAQVDWLHVALLAVFAFVATAVANLLSLDRWISAWTAALLFAAMFVFWTYYPHGPSLPTSIADQKSTIAKDVTAAPTGTAAPQRPNPVRDITPPR